MQFTKLFKINSGFETESFGFDLWKPHDFILSSKAESVFLPHQPQQLLLWCAFFNHDNHTSFLQTSLDVFFDFYQNKSLLFE